MQLNDLKEPDLSQPEKFMNDLFMIGQELYGSATDNILEFVGYKDGSPQMWHDPLNSIKRIAVNKKSREVKEALIFELSHEVFHALMPNTEVKYTSILEEGMATDFSFLILENFGYSYDKFWNKKNNLDYQYALRLVRDTKINQPGVIKKIRDKQSHLSDLEKETILANINLCTEDVNALLGNFSFLA